MSDDRQRSASATPTYTTGDRLRDIIDENFSMQPVMSDEDALTFLERKLFEGRQRPSAAPTYPREVVVKLEDALLAKTLELATLKASAASAHPCVGTDDACDAFVGVQGARCAACIAVLRRESPSARGHDRLVKAALTGVPQPVDEADVEPWEKDAPNARQACGRCNTLGADHPGECSADSSCHACEMHQDESQLVVAEVRAVDIEERWVRLRIEAGDEEMRGWARLLGQLIQIQRAPAQFTSAAKEKP